MDHLKNALAARKAKGIDIHIMVGHKPDDKTDLAPPGNDDPSAPNPHPLAAMHKSVAQNSGAPDPEMGAPTDDPEMQEHLMGGMSDHDMEHLQKPGNAKSLGQKARLAALLHHKK